MGRELVSSRPLAAAIKRSFNIKIMKKITIFLGVATLVLSVDAVFAFKTNAHAGQGNLYHIVNGICVLNVECKAGGTTDSCPGGPYYSDPECRNRVLNTKVVPA